STSISGATTRTTRPVAPTQLTVSSVTVASVTVAWVASLDTGGDPLVRQTLSYSVSGTVATVQLDATAVSYTISGLAGSTSVDDISVAAENSAGSSSVAETVSASTSPSEAPTISSLADTATLAGEATSPQAFTVADFATEPSALTVRASSSNANLVPPSSVAIGGIGTLRFVVVTPVAGTTGSAVVTLSVTNEAGLAAAASFQVTVEEAWQSIYPTSGYATGGTQVTVSGAGFDSASDYTCRFAAGAMVATSGAAVLSGASLVCVTPGWLFVAQGVGFSLLKGAAALKAGAQGE
ncbi:hypothetical protein T484DRAFT_1832253, partial [Baffinella frigidus]